MVSETASSVRKAPARFYTVTAIYGLKSSIRGATSAAEALSIFDDFRRQHWNITVICRGTERIAEADLRSDAAEIAQTSS